jgi:NAD(P)-dependent dehydrogenase (short-subunit alcohol dehydrogenase family)
LLRKSRSLWRGERLIGLAVSRYGRVEAIVNTVGRWVFANRESEPTACDRVVAIGISAPFHLTSAAIPNAQMVTDALSSRPPINL